MSRRIVRFDIEAKTGWRTFRGASGVWVGVCDPLNLTVQGDTWGEMSAAAGEALQLLFADLIEAGDMPSFLKKLGWKTDTPLPSVGEEVHFDLPMYFREHGSDRRQLQAS